MSAAYILLAILIFGVLIAIHEFGHFSVAKLCGVKDYIIVFYFLFSQTSYLSFVETMDINILILHKSFRIFTKEK